MKSVAIFWREGEIPWLNLFGEGMRRNGYSVNFIDPNDFAGQECDIAIVSGGLRRYKSYNYVIMHYYRSKHIPVFIIEHGRLVPQEIIRGYWLHYVGEVPMLPRLSDDMTHDRREKLGLVTNFKERGDAVLVVGQELGKDKTLGIHVMERLREYTDRKIIYRPRLTEGEDKHCCDLADEVSRNAINPWKDLNRAWCVITTWSNMGGEALMQGIPVIASPMASYSEYCQSDLGGIDNMKPPLKSAIEEYLMRYSYLLWSNEEMKLGKGATWMMEHEL